jgi:tRNA/rRNA methyltransferase
MPNHLPIVILVRPQMGENIGAVARAMSNFGIKSLRLVAPRDGWPNPKAAEMAAGAEAQIENAEIFPDLASASADLQWLYATTARTRHMEKQVLVPKAAMEQLHGQVSGGGKVGLVFGPERSGLDNEDINRCDTFITIPTAPENTSLNLAQSAVILGYEWWQQQAKPAPIIRDISEIAPREEWDGMFSQLEGYLDASDYFRAAEKKPIMWQNVRNMLHRSGMTAQELRTFRGMLRSLWDKNPLKH